MKQLYITILLISALNLNAQVGVNTEAPQGIFHVDGQGNTPATGATTSELIDDFVVEANTGNVGIGTNAPQVKLDIRNTSGNSALGLGNTTLSASSAAKGAMRYNGTNLQYSNGTEWVNMVQTLPVKTVFIATKTTNTTYAYEPGGHSCTNCNVNGAPHRTSAYLTEWTQKYNNSTAGGSFDAATGVFTANRSGTFTATFTFSLESGRIWAWQGSGNAIDTNQIEAIWRVYDTNGTTEINSVKCANTFPSDSRLNQNDAGNARAGSSCTGSIYLHAGQKIRPALWIDLNPNGPKLFDLTLASGSSVYNNLTIVEN